MPHEPPSFGGRPRVRRLPPNPWSNPEQTWLKRQSGVYMILGVRFWGLGRFTVSSLFGFMYRVSLRVYAVSIWVQQVLNKGLHSCTRFRQFLSWGTPLLTILPIPTPISRHWGISGCWGFGWSCSFGYHLATWGCRDEIQHDSDSERGNFKLFGLIQWLYLREFELFGARLLKKRDEV